MVAASARRREKRRRIVGGKAAQFCSDSRARKRRSPSDSSRPLSRGGSCGSGRGSNAIGGVRIVGLLKHDPEKWAPVFGKDHAQTWRYVLRPPGRKLTIRVPSRISAASFCRGT